ncbi:hypothetical protein CMK11_11690 [Candidatus Poribacteria bacterium]|nr:hypothetical protein [Candidatus Poribacteria bacterium]
MIDLCLSCDWNFTENPDDRGQDDARGHFCKWCSGDGKVALSYDVSVEKLTQYMVDREDAVKAAAQPEAEKRLSALDVRWADG